VIVPERARAWGRRIRPYAPMLVALALLWPFLSPPVYLGDHLTFWSAGHLAAQGGSPYDGDALRATSREAARTGIAIDPLPAGEYLVDWAYPPWTAFALVPFGALPVELGLPLLHLTFLAAAVAAFVAFALAVPGPGPRPTALGLVFGVLYQPMVITIRSGHFGGLLLAGAALVLASLRTRRPVPLIAGALLLSLKPQLAVGTAAVVAVVLVRERRYRDLVLASGTLVLLATIAFAARPDAVQAMSTAFAERFATRGSTVWTAVPAWLADPVLVGLLLAAATALLCAAAVLRAGNADAPYVLFAASWVITLGVLPYAQQYDQVLLMPGMLFAVVAVEGIARGRRAYLVWLTVTLVLVPWALFLPTVSERVPVWSGFVPTVMALVLLVATARRPARIAAGTPARAPAS